MHWIERAVILGVLDKDLKMQLDYTMVRSNDFMGLIKYKV